ncbi:hypothetical protein Ait01nite_057440 [Actinoplanes italicus]|nr:hypothetical protein Ait01nite_057440 [Actinoplanes italicus]
MRSISSSAASNGPQAAAGSRTRSGATYCAPTPRLVALLRGGMGNQTSSHVSGELNIETS